MKWILRTYLYTFFAVWLAEQGIPGFTIDDGMLALSVAAAGMVALNTFVKPLLKIILLPLNVATLGIVSIFINAGILWILTYFLPEVSITAWVFDQTEIAGVVMPRIEFGIISSYIVTAFTISGIIVLLQWIRD